MRSGRSLWRKCTPSTMASSETTRSNPGRVGMTAASSPRPSARGSPRVSGASRAIQANSSGESVIARDGIEDAVDEARFRAAEEGLGDLQVLVDRHLARNVLAEAQFEHRAAQDGADGGVEALQPPVGRQALADGGVDLALGRHDAAGEVGEEWLVSPRERFALEIGIEAVVAKLPDHRLHAGARGLHLVEGLHRRETRDGPGPAPGVQAARPGLGSSSGASWSRPSSSPSPSSLRKRAKSSVWRKSR